jgi:peroxiredoxin
MNAFINNQKYSLALVFALIITAGFGWHSPRPGFIIQGNIQGVPAGTAYLTYEFNYKDHTDSASIKDGQFTLKGQLPEPLLCTLRVSGSQQIRIFFAENTTMQVTATVTKLFDARISGGAEQDIWNGFNKVQREVIGAKVMEVRKRPRDSSEHRLSPADAAEIDVVKDSVMRSFVATHTNSVATARIIYETYIMYPDYQRAGALYALLNNKIKQCYYARRIHQNVNATDKTVIGAAAPAFTLPDTTGKMVSLAGFKGQYVLVDFWASWCPPCRAENPNVVIAFNKYKNKNFTILGVSLDKNKEKWMQAIKEDQLKWTQVSDLAYWDSKAVTTFGFTGIPYNVLIDPDGNVVGEGLRGEELEHKLQEIFLK